MKIENLEKALQYFVIAVPESGEQAEAYFWARKALTVLRSMPEDAKSGWTSVKDRLPETYCGESDNVLVVDEIGIRKILYFDGGCWCYPTGETYERKVFHWMPLPEPPEES